MKWPFFAYKETLFIFLQHLSVQCCTSCNGRCALHESLLLLSISPHVSSSIDYCVLIVEFISYTKSGRCWACFALSWLIQRYMNGWFLGGGGVRVTV